MDNCRSRRATLLDVYKVEGGDPPFLTRFIYSILSSHFSSDLLVERSIYK